MTSRRASVRLRLTLTYSALFVTVLGTVLAVGYVLVRDQTGGAKTAVSVLCSRGGQVAASGFSIQSGGGLSGTVASGTQNLTCSSQVHSASSGTIVSGNTVRLPAGAPVPGDPGSATIRQLAVAVNASRDRTLNTLLIESLIALATMGVLSVGLGWWMAGKALKPVHRITDTARRLSEQTLHDRINLEGPNDELKELANTFDDMLGRLDRAFASQSRFVANASHELRTPLATERVLVDEALANPHATVEELQEILRQLRANSEDSERLINGLLTLARSDRGVAVWSEVDLEEVAKSSGERVAPEASARQVEVRTELSPAPTTGDTNLLERLCGNLLENAVRHNHPGGWVSVASGHETTPYLEVVNTGPVIDASAVDGLRQPFRRGVGERHSGGDGFGLGLSIVEAVVSAHGGRLILRPRPEGGLIARVELRVRSGPLELTAV